MAVRARAVTPAEARLGFPTRAIINPVTDTVATIPTQILQNNPDRIFLLIVNLSANTGYVGWDARVSADRGIPLAPYGGYISLSIEEDGELVIYEVWAVNEAAAGKYYVVEIERM